MLTGLLIGLISTALAIHFLFVERPRRKRLSVRPALPEPLPPREALNSLPDDVYLQTGFTWTRILENGDILVGIHPILVSLVGSPYSLKVMPEGWRLAKGSPMVRIRQERREIRIGSPVSGRIAEVNPNACMEQGWTLSTSADDVCWIYRMEAQNIFHEAPLWMEGEEAAAWSREKYREIRDHLTFATAHQEVHVAPADSDDMPIGLLGQLAGDGWESFQDAFLPSVPKK